VHPPRTSAPARRRAARGFTLIELLVVIVIIGVMLGAMFLSMGARDHDSQLDQERDRLAALVNYVQERAALQTVEYGLRCDQGGYRFVMYDPRRASWLEDPLDETLRARRLPAGLELALSVEDRPIVLPGRSDPHRPTAATDLTPQVMIYSSGELTSFRLTLTRAAAHRSVMLIGASSGKVQIAPVGGPAT
ncbi:MAG: type II secretion system minor pseudopilin GspH, partial [Gammaproteobacteria bacterium]|nr:type II secretion system minor pseudopilin GspH [Gammaproteobacteria bacterium]